MFHLLAVYSATAIRLLTKAFAFTIFKERSRQIALMFPSKNRKYIQAVYERGASQRRHAAIDCISVLTHQNYMVRLSDHPKMVLS